MVNFVLRLFIAIGIILLTQLSLTNLNVDPRARSPILIVVTILMILFLIFGEAIFHIGTTTAIQ